MLIGSGATTCKFLHTKKERELYEKGFKIKALLKESVLERKATFTD